jgi:Uma2 family endonuclease
METMLHPPRTGLEVFEMLPAGTLCQLINNNIIMSPAATPSHQMLLDKLFSSIKRKVLANDLGTVFFSPIDVYLNNSNVYQPDIAYVAKARLGIINWDKGIMDAPDLAIEVLSKGNKKYDKVDKKKVYEQCGVKEYWLVDYKTKWCEGFELVDGKFVSLGTTTGRVHIKLLDVVFSF